VRDREGINFVRLRERRKEYDTGMRVRQEDRGKLCYLEKGRIRQGVMRQIERWKGLDRKNIERGGVG
jgi:hypothetical protein